MTDDCTSSPPGAGSSKRRRRGGRRRGRGNARKQVQPTTVATATQEAPPRHPGADAPVDDAGRALADSLREAVLRHTTAAVLGRGKGYAKRNRVSALRVGAGRVRARVQGTGAQRYQVELATPGQTPPEVVRRLRWSCNCPYAAEHRRGTCKHVVAVALVAAERLARTESLRRRWLGEPSSNAAEAEPAELDALAERLLAAFTLAPASVDDVLARAMSIAPAPFEVSVPSR
ncbi:MAG: hypothetical protein JOZ99_13890 [Actinobacteria bacterium]|nr:hypothetical protein [Actinomycetota bacterium]